MPLNWEKLQETIAPVTNYKALVKRWQQARKCPVIAAAYDFTLEELDIYNKTHFGYDPRDMSLRHPDILNRALEALLQTGIKRLYDVFDEISSEADFEIFVARYDLVPEDMIELLKYLIYWVIPKKRNSRELFARIPMLADQNPKMVKIKVRSNFDLLEQGHTPQGRQELAEKSGVPLDIVETMVHFADQTRVAWSSVGTVTNIINSGYISLSDLAEADLETLTTDFLRYGESIGKNLRLGHDIGSTHYLAKLVPRIVIE